MYLKTKTLTTAALLSFYVSASTALAATATIAITADDSVAGIGTNVTVEGLQGRATVVVLPPYGSEILEEVKAENGETVELHIAGNDMQEAGLYEVSLEQDGSLVIGSQDQFTVLADTVDLQNSTIQSDHNFVDINANEEVEVSVILRDRYGNTVSGRPVKLISSRASDRIEMLSSQTDERGEQHFLVSAQDAGTIALRAVDLLSGNVLASDLQMLASTMQQGVGGYLPNAYTNMYAPQQPVQNQRTLYKGGSNLVGSVAGRALYGQISSFDVVDRFVIEMPADTKMSIALPSVEIAAIDINGQIVEDYTGTIELSSTDPNAILLSQGRTTFSESEQGVKRIPLGITFKTPGQQILHIQDSQDPSIMGEAAINVIGNVIEEPKQTISIESPKQNGVLNTTEITVEGKATPYANLIVTGGKNDAYGDTDENGHFAIPVELSADQIDHTLRIRDESGQNDSGNLRLKLDVVAPEVEKLTFTPASPKIEEDILVVVHITDDNDSPPSVVLTLEGEEYTLEEGSTDGTYQLLFSISEAGNYQPSLLVKDAAGNEKEILSSLEVRTKELPRIQNVQVEPKPSAALLQWDPANLDDDEESIDGYRIYVGDSPANFSHTLDTEADTLAANVAGLKPGSTYYFGVTALRGDEESPHKSELISTVIPGLTLDVIPGNGSLTLNWADIAEDYSLSHFILSYGASQASMTETRKLNSNLTTYAMRDLINGVTYYISIVPISTEGETMDDLAVDGSGTPNSTVAGFLPGPADPIPAGLGSGPGFTRPVDPTPPISLHGGAPEQPTTGIPFSKWWIVLSGALCAGWFTLRRQKTLRTTNAFMHSMQERYTEEHLS